MLSSLLVAGVAGDRCGCWEEVCWDRCGLDFSLLGDACCDVWCDDCCDVWCDDWCDDCCDVWCDDWCVGCRFGDITTSFTAADGGVDPFWIFAPLLVTIVVVTLCRWLFFTSTSLFNSTTLFWDVTMIDVFLSLSSFSFSRAMLFSNCSM